METQSQMLSDNINPELGYQVGQEGGYSQNSTPLVRITNSKDKQVTRKGNTRLSSVRKAHSDDVKTLLNGDVESDQMFPACETNTELCVAGTSSGLQNNVEIKAQQKIVDTGKPFTCDLCGAGFPKPRALVAHVRSHTGEKPYICDLCGVGFSENGNLKAHKRTHTGEKPYKCDSCEAGFSQRSNLKAHKRTHEGEKPYKCYICGVGFSQHGNLKVHRRTHTGEKPYKCDVCGVGFVRSGHLKRHKIIHTREKN